MPNQSIENTESSELTWVSLRDEIAHYYRADEHAEDIAQVTILRLIGLYASPNDIQPCPRSYAFTTAAHVRVDIHRRQRGFDRGCDSLTSLDGQELMIQDISSDPFEQAAAREVIRSLSLPVMHEVLHGQRGFTAAQLIANHRERKRLRAEWYGMTEEELDVAEQRRAVA